MLAVQKKSRQLWTNVLWRCRKRRRVNKCGETHCSFLASGCFALPVKKNWTLYVFVFVFIDCVCVSTYLYSFLQMEHSRRLQGVHVCTFPVNEPLLPSIYLLTNNFFYFIFLIFECLPSFYLLTNNFSKLKIYFNKLQLMFLPLKNIEILAKVVLFSQKKLLISW